MSYQISSKYLLDLSKTFTYKLSGDKYEVMYGDAVIDIFKSSETFWRKFITPLTMRILANQNDPNIRIRPRSNISLDLQELSSIHYSVFLNLAYAEQCLITKQASYFENFYTHLGSACDLAEEFLINIYFLILKCENKETEVLQKLSKGKFLNLAKEWYDKYYPSTYEHYLSKGKAAPIKLISRSNILDEYFEKSKELREYNSTAILIRTYRNVVVHNSQIGSIFTEDGRWYVPRKNKISKYRKWHQVFSVKPRQFPFDFIEKLQQMREDANELKTRLNSLWKKPITDFENLLYLAKNKSLLSKYDLEFVD